MYVITTKSFDVVAIDSNSGYPYIAQTLHNSKQFDTLSEAKNAINSYKQIVKQHLFVSKVVFEKVFDPCNNKLTNSIQAVKHSASEDNIKGLMRVAKEFYNEKLITYERYIEILEAYRDDDFFGLEEEI